MVTLPSQTATLDSIYVMGTKLKKDIVGAVTSASLSMSTSQVTQLTIEMVDKGFAILGQGLFKIGTPVRYKDLYFVVSNTETKGIAGNEGLTIKCRPETVSKLKARRGTKVMSGASPSEFVIAECKAIGASYYVQPSAKRSSVARDVPKAKEKYEKDQEPSSWTTFDRLANELGYAMFEMAGVIYFAKPSYILNAAKKSPLNVTWRKSTYATESETVPVCIKSADSKSVSVDVTLPPARAKECRVGRAMKLSGVPTFDGYYLVDTVDYTLSGQIERVSVSASTAIDPEAHPPDEPTDSSGGSIYKTVTVSSKGSWPINKKYHVGTAFGVRGSWAAGYHTGVDFPAPRGVPVYAVYDGTIIVGGWGAAYGNHVILKVGNNEYAYCHLSKYIVHTGLNVKSGQVLGYVGDTGRAFGTHLHLELRVSPYRYGTDSRNPIPTLGKTITTTSKKIIDSGTNYKSGRSGTKAASDFVAWALSRLGDTYVYGATRNPEKVNQHVFDCSALVQWAAYRVGISLPGDTYSQIPYLIKKNAQISVSKAINTRGALLYKGFQHVAISLGNGRTIEAANSRVGVVSYSAKNRGFDRAFLVPGMHY